MKKIIFIPLLFFFLLVFSLISYSQTHSIEDFVIRITFHENPGESLKVYKAPLKYNKDLALVVHLDNSSPVLNNVIMPFFKGQDNYPGLFYCEGPAGSDQPFKMDAVQYCFNENDEDIHAFNETYLNWDELINLKTGEFGVVSNGLKKPADEDPAIQVMRGASYTERMTHKSFYKGIDMKTYVAQESSEQEISNAKMNFLGVYSQAATALANPINPMQISNFQGVEFSRTLMQSNFFDQVALVAEQSSPSNPLIASFYADAFSFSGTSLNNFLQQMTRIASTYGRDGEDKIWSTSSDELFEYLRLNEYIYIQQSLVGNQLEIRFTTGAAIPTDFSFYASTIVVESDAIITDVTVTQPENMSTYYYRDGEALFNLKWRGAVEKDIVEEATLAVEHAELYPSEAHALVAMDKVLMLPESTTQLNLRNRLCQFYQFDYETGFCPESTFLGEDTTVCLNTVLYLAAPENAYEFLWSTGDTERYIAAVCDQDTTFWVQATMFGGNVVSDTIHINTLELPTIDVSPRTATIEPGEFITLTATGGVSYLWSTEETTPSITPVPMTTTEYIVEGANEYGCVDTAQCLVDVYYKVDVDFYHNIVCIGDTTYFVANTTTLDSIFAIEWDLNGDAIFETVVFEDTIWHRFEETGEHLVGIRVKTMSGNIATHYKLVPAAASPVAEFSASQLCTNSSTIFTDKSTIDDGTISQWYWDFGNGSTSTSKNPLVVFYDAGEYPVTLVVTSNNGCSDTLTRYYTLNTTPDILLQLSDGTIVFENDEIELPTSGSLTFQVLSAFDQILWSTGGTEFSTTITQEGFYEVSVMLNGCMNSLYFMVEGEGTNPEEPSNDLMNFMTPNGDGYNDTWSIGNLSSAKLPAKVVVYSRAGKKVYENSNYENDWDGTYKGNSLPEGPYFYVIEMNDGEVLKGTISILK
ncbi:MAG: gliding motility-associated C-terminal domain-containing protein [Lentimicrobiaceae bacterium]|jgi:gliding motility-associated-like protein|nr:gliding motility-associated C-terminal domain-containing protein [Lentimicrobiaceae bacterium]